MKKLRIKETGEVVELIGYFKRKSGKPDFTLDSYDTLNELCEAVEDYKEPKGIQGYTTQGEDVIIRMGSVEEAEKAVEKLKAWTRLENKGFKFTGYDLYSGSGVKDKTEGEFAISAECSDFVGNKDLDLLFGGE